MKHRPARASHLPACLLFLIVAIGALLVPVGTRAEYAAVPGSADNTIRLTIECPPQWSITAEVLAQPAWMSGLTLVTSRPNSDSEVRAAFEVDPTAGPGESGTLVLSLTARDSRGEITGHALRRLPFRLAVAAPPVQSTYRIEECCLPAAGVEGMADGRPDHAVLLGAAPNPWSAGTNIRFGLAAGGSVTLRVLNVAGRLVRETSAPDLAPGYHQIAWNGCGPDGQRLPPGIYFYELSSSGWVLSGKTLLLR